MLKKTYKYNINTDKVKTRIKRNQYTDKQAKMVITTNTTYNSFLFWHTFDLKWVFFVLCMKSDKKNGQGKDLYKSMATIFGEISILKINIVMVLVWVLEIYRFFFKLIFGHSSQCSNYFSEQFDLGKKVQKTKI